MPRPRTDSDPEAPKVLEKALRVLEAFDDQSPAWAEAALRRHLSMPSTTLNRILRSLERAGYLVRYEDGRTGQAGTASYVRRRKRTPKAKEERLRLSFPPAGCQHAEDSVRRAHRRGPVRHKWGTLATSSAVCNRFPSLKVTNSPMCEDRTKS